MRSIEKFGFSSHLRTGLKTSRSNRLKFILDGDECSDWLPELVGWVYRALSGFPALVPEEKVFLAIVIKQVWLIEIQRDWSTCKSVQWPKWSWITVLVGVPKD